MAKQSAQIIRDLRRHAKAFDITTVGKPLMDISATGILRNMNAQVDPDGKPWAELSAIYDAWKSRRFPGRKMAVLYGIMKTREQVEGRRWMSPERGRMAYGVSAQAMDEASWFQEGNANQPERRFYELDQLTVQLMDDWLERHFAKIIYG